MPILGFTMFKEKILDGTKRQTIRKLGKAPPKKKGDMLYLYWHLRAKDCEVLGKSVCTEVLYIQIHDVYWLGRNRLRLYEPPIDEDKVWTPLSIAGADDIARLDGFNNSDELREFIVKHYPLPDVFQVIRWGELMKHEEKIHNPHKKR